MTRNSLVSSAIGVGIGAVVVGGVWYGTYLNHHIVAKVGNVPITRTQFISKVEAASGNQTMNQLISDQLIQEGAKKYHITASKSEIQQALKSIEAQNQIQNQAQLNQALSASGLTMAELNQSLRMQVLEQKLAERNVKVTNQALQTYFKQNIKNYTPKGKSAPPLSAVKSQVVKDYKQSQAQSPQVLLASLAKQFPIQIADSKYQSVKKSIENPMPALPGLPPAPPSSSAPASP